MVKHGIEPAFATPTVFQAFSARAPELAGRFSPQHVLGVGGMGVVFAAFDRKEDRHVAIKLLRQTELLRPKAIARMLREARVTAALQSEHAVRLFEVGRLREGAPYIVMERLSGFDLASRLRSRALTRSDVVDVIIQACDAIGEAHDLGIVHRDVKPSNVFLVESVTEGWGAKVLDFGVALEGVLDADVGLSTLTESGGILGSPAYMAPEQVRASRTLDGRADIWGLGVILYEGLSGSAPFRGANIADTLVRVVSERQSPVHSVVPSLPEGLASVVDMCLEKEPERRPQSAANLALALSPYASRRAARVLADAARHRSVPRAPEVTTLQSEAPMMCCSTAPPHRRERRGPALERHLRIPRGVLSAAGLLLAGVVSSAVSVRSSTPANDKAIAPPAHDIVASSPRAPGVPPLEPSVVGSERLPDPTRAPRPPAASAPKAAGRSRTAPAPTRLPELTPGPMASASASQFGGGRPPDDILRLDIRP